jgi:methyl-accepting chemotaxis protein
LFASPRIAGLRARLRRSARPAAAQAPGAAPSFVAAVQASRQLDCEIGTRLDAAVAQTEQSALAIMQQVRALCDGSGDLVARLQQATGEVTAAEQGIAQQVGALAATAQCLRALPQRMARDLEHIDLIAGEIRGLSGLAESIRAISLQSHLLSINAAIEASRAGPAGVAFKVVADEVRKLAADSSAAASRIGATLGRTHTLLQEGLELGKRDSTEQCHDIAHAADALAGLQASFQEVTAGCQARFAEVTRHGEDLAAGAAEVLGQLQYQDVVRQCVERLQEALRARGAALEAGLGPANAGPDALAARLEQVLAEYLALEAMHGRQDEAGDSGPAIELF